MIGDMVNCYDNHVNAEIVKVVVIVTCALLMNQNPLQTLSLKPLFWGNALPSQ